MIDIRQQRLMEVLSAKSAQHDDEIAAVQSAQNTTTISREDFDLLHVQDEDMIYCIVENDSTVTIQKGQE